MNETQVGRDRSIVAWLLRRPRTALGIVALIIGVAVIGAVGGTTLRSRARVDFVTQRLQDTGRIQALRLRLQRSLLNEVRDVIPGNSFIVEDLRLQVEQALALGEYLDPLT